MYIQAVERSLKVSHKMEAGISVERLGQLMQRLGKKTNRFPA
jgi:hypothetical protein